MKKITVLLSAIIMVPLLLFAQQSPDLDFNPSVESPRYTNGKGPKVGIDGAHNNLHQLDGGFAPFGKLLNADGYQSVAVDIISEEQLNTLDIFVIANPLHEYNIGNWQNPTPSAFTEEEIKLIESWVQDGGSLLVIADHMPFGGAANELAQQFGFAYENGFVTAKAQQWPPESYYKSDKTLIPSALTMGIDSLAGFTGSALKPAEGAMVIGRFSDTHQLLLPEVAWQFEENTEEKPLQGYVMGAAMKYGKGKVAFFTEAAMFTAQIVQEKYKVGFNSPRAPQNQQFVLNVLHWLDDNSPESRVYENLWAMKQAYEVDDMQKVASLYTKDGVIYQPSGGEVRGMEAIQAYWQGLKGKGISWNSWLLEVEPMGDQILAVFRLDLSYKNYEDKAVTSPSKAMLIYKKENGMYKLYKDFYVSVKKWEKSPFDFTGDKEMENKDFSFWLGSWKVYKTNTDTLVGMSRIQPMLDGTSIRESYYSTLSKYNGTSINTYVADANRWEQYWVDNSGTRLMLRGGFSEGKMVLSDCQGNNKKNCNRISWQQEGEKVRQIWEQSEDEGKSWEVVFDGTYVSMQ